MAAPTAPIHLRAQGMDALKSQRFDAAVESLNRYLDAAPNDTEAELALAAARAGQGKHVAALTIFERHLEREPQSPSLHYNRGTTLERLGRKDDAVKAYKMVLKLKPEHAKAQQRLQSLGGIARPLPAGDIPLVIAVDGDDGAARRPKGKGRWIHPGALVGLVVYVVVVMALAFVAMPVETAAGYAGAAVFSSLLFLGGLQAVHRSRRGLSRLPAAVGHILVIIGALGLVNDGVMDVYYLVTGRQTPARYPVAGRPTAAGNVQGPQDQGSRLSQAGSADNSAARKDFGKNPGLIDTAIQIIRSADETQMLAACLALTDNYRDDRKGEVIPLLEGLLTHARIPVRSHAARALGTWGTQESIPKLQALTGDRSGLVRSAAAKAIETIKQRKP